MNRKNALYFVWPGSLLIGCLPACRTAPVWKSAKDAVCKAETEVKGAVTSLAGPLGLPGTVAAALVNAGLGLMCGAVGVAADAGAGVTEAVIDTPLEAVGITPPTPPTPIPTPTPRQP